MSEEVKNLIKKTWVDYYSGHSKEIEKQLEKSIVVEYREAMLRLETDFDFQAELGIGM
jgi:hypothetical protein